MIPTDSNSRRRDPSLLRFATDGGCANAFFGGGLFDELGIPWSIREHDHIHGMDTYSSWQDPCEPYPPMADIVQENSYLIGYGFYHETDTLEVRAEMAKRHLRPADIVELFEFWHRPSRDTRMGTRDTAPDRLPTPLVAGVHLGARVPSLPGSLGCPEPSGSGHSHPVYEGLYPYLRGNAEDHWRFDVGNSFYKAGCAWWFLGIRMTPEQEEFYEKFRRSLLPRLDEYRKTISIWPWETQPGLHRIHEQAIKLRSQMDNSETRWPLPDIS